MFVVVVGFGILKSFILHLVIHFIMQVYDELPCVINIALCIAFCVAMLYIDCEVIIMTNNELPAYYTVLFSAAADALEAMEQQNFGTAKERLLQGMQQAEELYLEEK